MFCYFQQYKNSSTVKANRICQCWNSLQQRGLVCFIVHCTDSIVHSKLKTLDAQFLDPKSHNFKPVPLISLQFVPCALNSEDTHTHCSCITVQYTVHLTGTAQLVQLLYYNFNILYFTPSNLLMYVQFHLSLWIAVDLTDQLLTLPKICPHLIKSAQASTAL